MTISRELQAAIELFHKREAFRLERQKRDRTLDQVMETEGLVVGQIWRPKFDGIVTLWDTTTTFSVTSFCESSAHLVVVLDATETPYGSYHKIRVVPIYGFSSFEDSRIEHPSEDAGDIVIKDETIMGYPFVVAYWNAQDMLRENLDMCLGQIGNFQTLVNNVKVGIPSDERVRQFRAELNTETEYLRAPCQKEYL